MSTIPTAPYSPSRTTGTIQTLVQLLRARARERPHDTLYTFVHETEAAQLTFGQLDLRARRLAFQLRGQGKARQRALLLYEPGLEYIVAFFGCLYANIVPVPAYPPDPTRRSHGLKQLASIATDATVSLVLSTTDLAASMRGALESIPHAMRPRLVLSDVASTGDWSGINDPGADADDVAFLQYTSGSTGHPKGVMLSHRNLLENLRAIENAFGVGVNSKGLVWLPPYHDMGLIGGILVPLWVGFEVVLMSPIQFARQPLSWLRAVSTHRATVSGGPNFAFELCARRARRADLENLDLSGLQVAFVGSDPVRAETLERFVQKFEPCGFRQEALLPCYGMAEATLLVTGARNPAGARTYHLDAEALRQHRAVPVTKPRSRTPSEQCHVARHADTVAKTDVAVAFGKTPLVCAPETTSEAMLLDVASNTTPRAVQVVGCGKIQPGMDIRIVDPVTGQPRSGSVPMVGEIWIRSPSVARGYFDNPEETDRVFGARLTPADSGPWLRTGDLGVVLGDGDLVVTGRNKDLMIVRGKNHYPQDVEATIGNSHRCVRPGRVAAFSVVVDGAEEAAAVLEVSPGTATNQRLLCEIATAVKQAVTREHGVTLKRLALVSPGQIPKTSSGKLQRNACRTLLLENQLQVSFADDDKTQQRRLPTGRMPQTVHERRVADVFRQVLGCGPLGVDDEFFALGGDSLAAAQAAARLDRGEGAGVEKITQAIQIGRTVGGVAQWLEATPAQRSDASPAVAKGDSPTVSSHVQTLVVLASEVLETPDVDPTASFFEMGGTSLSAMLLLARIQETFNVQLPLETFLNAPTIAGLSEHVTAAQRRAVAQEKESKGAREKEAQGVELAAKPVGGPSSRTSSSNIPPLRPAERPPRVPLSYSQQGLWLVDQFGSAGLAYSIPIALRITGPLDSEALVKSFTTIVSRHEALRTTFHLCDGQPFQRIETAVERWPLYRIDCSGTAPDERDAACITLGRTDASEPFDLSVGPLFRTKLVRFSDDDHLLLISMHHIVSDGWSMGVLLREFKACYTSYCVSQEPQLAPLPIQYADYSVWQRSWMDERHLAPSLEYFRQHLSGVPALCLPTQRALERDIDKGPTDLRTGRGNTVVFSLERSLIGGCKALAAAQGASLFMVLLAAYRVLLAKLARQTDFAVGVPVANRLRQQLEALIGFFVNTLALRQDLRDNPSFTDIVARERQTCLLAFGHQDVPFEKVVAALAHERDHHKTPLVSVMFALQNAPLGALEVPGLQIAPVWGTGVTSKFDVILSIMEWNGEYLGQLEYATDLFAASSAQSMAEAYVRVLRCVCETPHVRLAEMDLEALDEALVLPSFEAPATNPPSQPSPSLSPENAVAPRTDIERRLQELVAEVLDGHTLGVTDHFFGHGGDSLTCVLLLARVRDDFGVDVPIEVFFADPTIAKLAEQVLSLARHPIVSCTVAYDGRGPVKHEIDTAIVTDADADADNCVVLREGTGPYRIFLVHAIFGDVFCYQHLAQALPPEVGVVGLQAKLEGADTIENMTDTYVRALRRLQPSGPYCVGGFSYGGVVAFEMVRRLAQGCDMPSRLILIDSHIGLAGRPFPESQRDGIHQEAKALSQFLPIDEGGRNMYVQMVCRHIDMLEHYAPKPLRCHRARATLLRASRETSERWDLGWSDWLQSPVHCTSIDASHQEILQPPHVERVANVIATAVLRS